MGSERFASPIMGIFCGGLNAYCMRIWPLFLRTSGSSGVLKALLLERNRQLSCNQKKKKKKKKKKKSHHHEQPATTAQLTIGRFVHRSWQTQE